MKLLRSTALALPLALVLTVCAGIPPAAAAPAGPATWAAT